MTRKYLLVFALAFLLLPAARILRAEELSAEQAAAEAKEAEDEDKNQKDMENKLDRPISANHTGTLTMNPPDKRSYGIVGQLIGKDKVLTLKVSHADLVTKLDQLDGKKVKVDGNPRNKGKYFVVSGITKFTEPK